MEEDNSHATYEHPLVSRYANKMSYIWSPQKKFSTWRKLWLALAESERALGLDITEEQVTQMAANLENIDFELAERKRRSSATM